ncbi:hypothetical protein LUZ62_044724 [Rhynchospora pubera]|uniref:Aminotransferase-like plant mobile domain-containing protein n=1 Tax=Rhynchospora pubera TaxID=906938 RepID=A0AAV8FRV5_9POAL|nr:hypothetical protein LUZ62_044724 [Rhynchospora pubera]
MARKPRDIGKGTNSLIMRKHKICLRWNDNYKEYLENMGLYGVHQIGYILSDKALVSALVERWKPTTHTFYFPVGEMTITLEDVAMLMGLPIEGEPVCEETRANIVEDPDWPTLIQDYLGCEVDEQTFRRRSKTEIRIKWMKENFGTCPEGANEETVKCHARAYMLMLLGSVLFTSRSGDSISVVYLPFLIDLEARRKYSWGSAVLACMYKELCQACNEPTRQIAGPILLLQLWSWAHFRVGRPQVREGEPEPKLRVQEGEEEERRPVGYLWSGRHEFTKNTARNLVNYRDIMDQLRQEEVYWQPYEPHRPDVPAVCTMDENLWMTTCPLIHLQTVETYNPGRVMRQFGKHQDFPPEPTTPIGSFGCIGRRGARSAAHRIREDYLDYWRRRGEFVIVEERLYDPSRYDAYIRWLQSGAQLHLQSPARWSLGDTPVNKLQYLPTEPITRLVSNKIMEMAEKTVGKMNGELADEDSMRAYMLDILRGCSNVLEWIGVNIGADPTFDLLRMEQHDNQMEYQHDGEASDEASEQDE